MSTAQLMTFDFSGWAKKSQQPCFSCVFGSSDVEETCDTVGVLAAATITIAALQAAEAIKLLIGKATTSNLLSLNVWDSSFLEINVKKKN